MNFYAVKSSVVFFCNLKCYFRTLKSLRKVLEIPWKPLNFFPLKLLQTRQQVSLFCVTGWVPRTHNKHRRAMSKHAEGTCNPWCTCTTWRQGTPKLFGACEFLQEFSLKHFWVPLHSTFASHEREKMSVGKRARKCVHYSEAIDNIGSCPSRFDPEKPLSLSSDASPH